MKRFKEPTEDNRFNNNKVELLISINGKYYEFDGEKFDRVTGRKIIICK